MRYNAGLILEGGGMRGVFTCGVIDAFIENDAEFSSIYGVSAGACHAVSLISKQLGRAYRITTNYIGRKDFMGVYSLLTTGNYFNKDMLFKKLHNELDPLDFDAYDAFIKNGKFYSVASNLKTGKAEYLTPDSQSIRCGMKEIRASSSLPIISKRCKIGDNLYLDGAMTDAIPIRKSIEDGNVKNVAVLTRNKEYVKSRDRFLTLDRLWYRRYPKFVSSIALRHEVYNETCEFLREEEVAGRVFVIRPQKPVEVGITEKDRRKLRSLYNQGYELACERMPALMRYLEK